MKKIYTMTNPGKILSLLILSGLFFSTADTNAQCTNASAFGTATAPTTATPLTISTCTFQTEYNTINSVAAGTNYTSTYSLGGCITVHRNTPGGPVVATGPSPLAWTSTTAGTYYIHYNTSCAPTCGTASSCGTSTITCTSCAGGGPNPCATITNIGACGTSVTANMSGTGAWNVTACGFTTSGVEAVFSFTPTTSGVYSINVTSVTGGFIDYFWSTSCGSTGWNCIDDVVTTGTFGSMNWTAGTTYYILLDPEGTAAVSQTFTIPCPSASNPCLAVTPMGACGTSQAVSLTGSGAWNTNPCGFTTGGQEAIYSFTPTTTGTHSINVNSFTGGFVDFGWSTTCGSTGWNCIDDVIGTGNYGAMAWTAGTTYYIILDAEGTAGNTVGFSINCPGSTVTASDCASAVNVCTNLSFAVDPNGYGTINELCTYCVSNPGTNPSSGNMGCLLSGELNSTWMVVNVATSGTLEFSFGSAGGPIQCYDWIMWPYNASACTNIVGNTHTPVRCNWNNPCSAYTGMATPVPAGGAAGNFEPELNVLAGQQFLICFSNYSSAYTTVPLQFFGTATISCTPLSSELVTFEGFKYLDKSRLEWKTNSNTNTAYYEVLHSLNGTDFTLVGKVEAEATSSASEFFYLHNEPAKGINYYKLISVDYDNHSSESRVVAVDFANEAIEIGALFPNPNGGNMQIKVNSLAVSELTVMITDIAGKTILTNQVTLIRGENNIQINADFLSKGIYNFIAINPLTQESVVQKLIVE